MIDWIIVALSIASVLLYIFIIYFMMGVRVRIKDGMKSPFAYIIVAVSLLIGIRILNLLRVSNIYNLKYSSEILVVVFSFLLFMGVFNFYKSIKSKTDRNMFKSD